MLSIARSRFVAVVAAPRSLPAVTALARRTMHSYLDLTKEQKDEFQKEGIVVPEIFDSLEWALDSPPPLHQFDESPMIVEIGEL